MPEPAIMCLRVPILSGYAKVAHRIVSLPRIDELLADPGSRYFLPPEPAAKPAPAIVRKGGGRPRGPSYATMVKDVRASATRVEFAKRLRKRLVRAKLIRPRKPRREDIAMVERLLGTAPLAWRHDDARTLTTFRYPIILNSVQPETVLPIPDAPQPRIGGVGRRSCPAGR